MNGEHKITSGHRARTALVYLRQSTLMQVREHTESTLRQYALAGQAARLGWAAADIEVIDAEGRARDADTAVGVAEDTVRRARLELLIALGRFPG